ncbi:hypothetical protein HR12_46420 [Microbacterium sp. SUBG005]|nr:hypothetical protein HR12_46420 [Microbacterium sp. SUBG005]
MTISRSVPRVWIAPLADASSAGTPYDVVSASSRVAPNARTCTSVPSARSALTSSVAWTPAPP